MNSLNQNKDRFKALQILHLALVMGVSFLCIIIGYLISQDNSLGQSVDWFEGYALFAILAVAIHATVSYVVWTKRQSNIPVGAPDQEKWNHFQSSSIVRWAILEAGVIISLVLAFLGNNVYLLAIAAVGIGFLLLARPSKDYLTDKYGIQG